MVPYFVPLLQYLGHTQIAHICHSQSNLVKLISSLAAVPFQVSGFALPSMHRSNSPHLKCPISETSATALRGTTANYSKEILKSNGKMKKQRWEESERRKWWGRRLEKRKSQKKEDAGAIAKHCVFQCFGSGEPSGQMRDEQLHVVVAQSTFRSQECLKTDHLGPLLEVSKLKMCTPLWHGSHFKVKIAKNWRSWTTFGRWDVEKVHELWREVRVEVKIWKYTMFDPLLGI